jgi:hypothetical protein
MDTKGGVKITTEIADSEKLYQRVHKSNIDDDGQIRNSAITNEIKRYNKYEMSVDLASLTTPPNNPNHTKERAKVPSDNGVISHIVINVKDYPFFNNIEHDPVENNNAHHNIKFQQGLNRQQIEQIARYIIRNKKFKWEIKHDTNKN